MQDDTPTAVDLIGIKLINCLLEIIGKDIYLFFY